jgi:hypothetical protein
MVLGGLARRVEFSSVFHHCFLAWACKRTKFANSLDGDVAAR